MLPLQAGRRALVSVPQLAFRGSRRRIHPTRCCRAPRAAFFDVLPGRAWVPSIDHYEAKASDTRRHLSVQLGPRRGDESAWCLLGFAGGNHADRAGFRHVFSDPHCLFSRNALLFHFSFRLWPAASEGKEQHRTACNGQPTSLLNSPASQEPSHPVTASQSRAGSRLLQPYSVRA